MKSRGLFDKSEVAQLATKYEYADFPKREDILAVIQVESRFDPKAHNRKSQGLMQVNNGGFEVEGNIKKGSALLHSCYKETGSEKGALLCYNVGLGGYKRGHGKVAYFKKVREAKALVILEGL